MKKKADVIAIANYVHRNRVLSPDRIIDFYDKAVCQYNDSDVSEYIGASSNGTMNANNVAIRNDSLATYMSKTTENI